MIIFGTRGVTYTANQGEFHCPQCGDRRRHSHKRVRRFFTLYFIPVIPMDTLGEYIECSRCRGTFDLRVLKYDPEAENAAFEAEFQRGLKRVMVLMMMADGEIKPEEIATIRKIYGELSGRAVSEEAVTKEIARAKREGTDVAKHLAEFAGSLNDSGKELVVKAALMVALADGEFAAEEQALMNKIVRAVQLKPAHYRGLLAELTNGARTA